MKVLSLTEPYATLIKEGRYAWILADIEVLDNPIKAKGHLSIWNYEN